MKGQTLTTLFCLLFISSLISQNSTALFTEVNELDLIASQKLSDRIITPNKYNTLLLDVNQLDLILNSVPREGGSGATRSLPFEIQLPEGETEAFHLVEYTMMEPGLAASFPHIKTYHGIGVHDPARRIRLDWTVNGLNAMLLLPEGLAFLKPYSKEDREHYLSYFERDLPVNTEPFNCGTLTKKGTESAQILSSTSAGDCQFRTYRLAVAVTGEYATTVLGASAAGTPADDDIVTAHIVTSINQINGFYERDVSARFILIANLSDVFYYNGATDPYTNSNSVTMLAENISNMDATIGSANFDLGHVLGSSAGGSGGVAGLNVLCGNSKARGVTQASAFGITQPRFLKVWSHEMGHQFGAGHTQGEQCQRSAASAMEPGAGTTLMSYVTSNCANQIQNIPDYYFHAISIQQMSARMLITNCAAILPNSNSAPTVSAGPDVTVPSSTPLLLNATASDPDNDPLTFVWEQFNNDLAEQIPPESTNLLGPNFRSLPPSSEIGRYLPNLAAVIAGTTPTWEVLPSVARTMNFRVTVRDNSINSVSCTAEDDVEITTVADGPFLVTSPNSSSVIWIEGETETVTWDVAGTNIAPVSCANVDILLSYDGGLTYPAVLANNVPNNGSASIAVPIGITTTARVQVRCSDNIFYNISAVDFEIQISNGPSFLLNLPNPSSTICSGDLASNVPVSTSSIAGFSGDVTLSASNLPGSTSITFANPIITAGSATTFEISNTSGLAEDSYTITITGTSGTIVRNFNYVLNVDAPAGTTTLDMPADNAIEIGLFPFLSWIQPSNASSYDIQISQDPTFASLIVNETVTTNSYTLNSALQGLTTYYWRVRTTTTNCGNTPWSSNFTFTTEDCDSAFIQNTPESISPNGTPEINSILTITDPGTVNGLEISNIIGTHTYVGDLEVTLIAPGGSPSVLLWDGECGSLNDFNLSLSDNATTPVASAPCSPLGQGGTFIPQESLSAFDGIPIAGDWTLRINDNANQDGGELTSWRLDFCSLVVLPVDLLSFKAVGQKEAIRLDWKTANEFNNSNFEIERRTDQTEFVRIGKVMATSEVQEINDYHYLDTSVRPGTRYYYRLRQNDYDGQFEHSEIRTAIIEDATSVLQVYPNPVRGVLNGLMKIESGSELSLSLYDVNGRVLKEQNVSGEEFVMNLAGILPGVYILKAVHTKGEEIIKLVVQ